MKCYYHPDAEAVATCSNCGRAICEHDAVDVAGRVMCQKCVSTASAPAAYASQVARPNHPLAVLSLAFGVLGIAGCLCGGGIGGILLGGPAAVLGYLSRKQLMSPEANHEGLAIANLGMALGIVEVSLSVILLLCFGGVYGLGFLTSLLEQLSRVR